MTDLRWGGWMSEGDPCTNDEPRIFHYSSLGNEDSRCDYAFAHHLLLRDSPADCTPCGHAIVTKLATMIDAIRKDPVGITFSYDSSSTVHQISEICGAAFEDQQIPDSVQIAPPPPKAENPNEKKMA
ncbi:hypothetical protein PGT21_017220 [Puccinia graminis f. sp. tritici]|uniref:Uncharacterized protein n=1 Tax=Puccinia graminis f. sp. tritici TaxID=56615 RepID=A0A5B0MUP2_PUCGR|nr:hypothetical protein PGT21_017220 [Puccinia graminis f. sp. tritici]